MWCVFLWIVKEYFYLCNYAWLFVEGFYLHSIIVLTFTNQKKLLLVSLCIGWGKISFVYFKATTTVARYIDLSAGLASRVLGFESWSWQNYFGKACSDTSTAKSPATGVNVRGPPWWNRVPFHNRCGTPKIYSCSMIMSD